MVSECHDDQSTALEPSRSQESLIEDFVHHGPPQESSVDSRDPRHPSGAHLDGFELKVWVCVIGKFAFGALIVPALTRRATWIVDVPLTMRWRKRDRVRVWLSSCHEASGTDVDGCERPWTAMSARGCAILSLCFLGASLMIGYFAFIHCY